MADHADIDHTGLTGIPAAGSVATDTIWDAAGDLAVGSGANTAAKLSKGTALQVLRVNSGATNLEWATPAAGAVTLLDTQTVTGSDGVLNLTAISASYNDLFLRGLVRDDDAAALVANAPLLQMGNSSIDTGSNYDWYDQQFRDNNTDADAGAEGVTAIQLMNTVNSAGATSGYWSAFDIEIIGYTGSPFKHVLVNWYTPNSAGDNRMGQSGGLWKSTSAVTHLRISGVSAGNLKIGSFVRLYGRL